MNKRHYEFNISIIALFYILVLFSACGKKPDGQITVTTKDAFDITGSSATVGGYVTSFGYTVSECGVCYSEQAHPITSDACTKVQESDGEFSATLSDLKSNTMYHVRAYAKTSSGIEYGNNVFFTTRDNYTINTFKNPTAGGTVSGAGAYQQGEECAVSATANNGYSFTDWTENGAVVSTDSIYSFTVTKDRNLMANFSLDSPPPTQDSTWLSYDNDDGEEWGVLNGGTMEWAVMFPSTMLEQYVGMKITKVKLYLGVGGSYNIDMFTGGTSPSTNIFSGICTLNNAGWWILTLHETVNITGQNLWVAVSTTHAAGEYPAGASDGINNPNARWINWGSHGWCDAYLSGWADRDLTWNIRAFVTSDGKHDEMELSPFEVKTHSCDPSQIRTTQGVGNKRNKRQSNN